MPGWVGTRGDRSRWKTMSSWVMRLRRDWDLISVAAFVDEGIYRLRKDSVVSFRSRKGERSNTRWADRRPEHNRRVITTNAL